MGENSGQECLSDFHKGVVFWQPLTIFVIISPLISFSPSDCGCFRLGDRFSDQPLTCWMS